MKLSYGALVITALGLECAIAQPAHHKHHHQHRRTYYDVSKVDWSKVKYTNGFGNGDAAPPAEADQSAPSPSPSPSPSVSSSVSPSPSVSLSVSTSPSSSQTPSSSGGTSCPGFGKITAPVDNDNKDQYIGNVGSPYGSNMKAVDSSDSCNCKYSIRLINNGGSSMEAIVWNKSGRDGQPQSGMSSEPNLNIPLGIGESKVVCLDENSQVAFSRNCKRSSVSNAPDCTWGEADFGDLRNGGWNGYDVSSIANSAGNNENVAITCAKGKTSSQSENSFINVEQEDAGGQITPGPMAIRAEWS